VSDNNLNIGVVGAGLMGHGIGYLLASAGHTVRIYDPSAEWRDSLPQRLEAARMLLDGDPALLGRVSAHDQVAAAMRTSPSCSRRRQKNCRSSSRSSPSLKA
jgi:3-hydroxyacyl-CoA dehydrogenase